MLDNNNKRKSLGRGLGALLGDDDIGFDDIEKTVNQATDNVDIELVVPSKYQPRTEFDEEALYSLSRSIKEKGVLQPLLVRKTEGKYELIAGERRLRAAKMAGLTEVPVITKDFSDQEVLEVALVENILRENLSAVEEAEGLQRLIDEFAYTQETLSQAISKSRSHVTNTLRLLTLPEEVKELVKENKLSAGHARTLVGLENASEIAKKIMSQDLSVRATEDLVNKIKNPKAKNKKIAKNEDLVQIEKDLQKNLGLKIKIDSKKVVLSYKTIAELDKIIDLLDNKK